MGSGFPQYELDQSVVNTVLDLIEKVKRKHYRDNYDNVTHRPLRPDEINPTFTVDNRRYDSQAIPNAAWTRILGATTFFTVLTGSVYLFLGWIVVDDPNNSIGIGSVARIKVQSVIRNEVCPFWVSLMENNAMLTLDQVIVAAEQTRIDIEVIQNSGAPANAIVFPLAFRIGPKAQLDVS